MTLSRSHRDLLARRLASRGLVSAAGAGSREIDRVARRDRAAVSHVQRRIWFDHQLDPASTAYNVSVVVGLTGVVYPDALLRALDRVVDRHEVLRTTYHLGPDGEPYQRVRTALDPDVAWVEPAAPDDDEEARLHRIAEDLAAVPFDLATESPLRVRLARVRGAELAVVLVIHHIAWDGASFTVFSRDLSAFYRAEAFGEATGLSRLDVQYADYAAWSQQALRHGAPGATLADRQLDYWAGRLADSPERLPLPRDREPGPGSGHEAALAIEALPAELAARLRELADTNSVSILMLYQAAVAIALHQTGAGLVIPFGSPVDRRTHEDLRGLIGSFVNSIVLTTDLTGDPTFTDLLRRVVESNLAAVDHGDVPFEKVVERLNPVRSAGLNPLFQVMVTNAGPPVLRLDAPGVGVRLWRPARLRIPVELSFGVFEADGILSVTVLHAIGVFDERTARRLRDMVIGVLAQVCWHPDLHVSEVASFGASEAGALPGPAPAAVAAAERAAAARLDDPLGVRVEAEDATAGLVDTAGAPAVGLRAVRLRPECGANHIAAAVFRCLARHDALRMRRGPDGTVGLASVAEVLSAPVLTRHTGPLDEAAAAVRSAVDLAAGHGLRAGLVERAADPDVLVLAAHRECVDDESWTVLLAEFATLRADGPAGRVVPPPSPDRFADYLAETYAAAEDLAILDSAEAWLDLRQLDEGDSGADRSGVQPPVPVARSTAGSGGGRASIELPLPGGAHPEDAGRLRIVVLTAFGEIAVALRGEAGGDLLVDLAEPDRDDPRHARTVGLCRREVPVRVAARRADGPAALRAVADRSGAEPVPASYSAARYLSPHTVGAFEDLPVAVVGLRVAVTDVGDLPVGVPGPATAGADRSGWAGEHGHSDWDIVVDPVRRRLHLSVRWRGSTFTEATARSLLGVWGDAVVRLAPHWLTEPAAAPVAVDLLALPPFERGRLVERFGALEDVLALSPLQEGLLFHLLSAGVGDDVYVSQTVVELAGPLDAARLRGSARRCLLRYPAVRAGFAQVGDRFVQVVPVAFEVPWRELDLRGAGADTAATDFGRLVEDEYHRPFDPGRPPLMRIALVSFDDDVHRLVFTFQHILLDGWSGGLFLRSFLDFYTDDRQAATRAHLPFRDYLRWLGSQNLATAEQAWSGLLAGIEEPTLLAPRVLAVAADSRRVDETHRELPAELSRTLLAAARRLAVTPSTLFELAWALVLMRLTGSDDVVFGSVVSGRPAEIDGIETTVGLLFNTVPERVRARPGDSVRAVAERLTRDKLTHLRHPYLSLSELLRLSGHQNLFDTLFVFQNHARLGAGAVFGPRNELRVVDSRLRDSTHYPITVVVDPAGDGFALRVMYRADVLDAAGVDTIVERYLAALAFLGGARPGTPFARADLLTAAERELVLHRWNDTAAQVPARSVSELLTERVAVCPDLPAVVSGAVTLSFADLAGAANRLARLLLTHGVRPEHRVALLLPRDERMVVALFAVFAAHAAYVPLDEEYPPERMAAMLDQSRPTVLLTTSALRGRLPASWADDPRLVDLDQPGPAAELARLPGTPVGPDERATPYGLDHLAYVIFTSGSTGRPKGVEVGYRGLTNMYYNHLDRIFAPVLAGQGGRRLRIAHTTSFAFDASWEQLLWLLAGHEVHVIDEATRRDPEALLAYFDRQRIDAFDVTPTYGQYLVDAGLLDRPRPRGTGDPAAAGVVFVSLGGEAVGEALWRSLRELPGVGGYNLYGPTEYTINALGADVRDSPEPTVGRPIFNTRAFILDNGLQPVPPGVVGELYLAGVGLARGYAGLAARTAERFVACPFNRPGERMYRTGDLARWRPDGGIDYLGRSDLQVKVRGYRVEPAEIEDLLMRHPAVGQAAVVPVTGADGAVALAAYVVPAPGLPAAGTEADPAGVDGGAGAGVDTVELREHLAAALPPYMVPTAVMTVRQLPLTVNGKLDVGALPPVDRTAARRGAAEEPQGAAERAVAEAFADVLELTEVGRHDDFFALGGHSLLVVRLVNRLRPALGEDLTVRQVYDAPTPARLAARTHTNGFAPVLELRAGRGPAVFCLPAAGGIGWSFAGLSRWLDPQWGVYALQDPALDGGPELAAFDELVASTADRVRAIRPRGPYHLLGWSFGGQLAHAVAVRLEAAGERVASLVLLDSYLLDGDLLAASGVGVPDPADAPRRARDFLAGSGVLADLAGDELDRVIAAFTRHSAMMLATGVSAAGEDDPGSRAVRAGACCAADALLISAELTGTAEVRRRRQEQWAALVRGELRTHPVDLRHEELGADRGWRAVGPVVAGYLRARTDGAR